MNDKAKRIELPPLPRRGLYEVDSEKMAADTKPKTRRDATRKDRAPQSTNRVVQADAPLRDPDGLPAGAGEPAAAKASRHADVEGSVIRPVPVVKRVRKAKAVLAVAEKKAKPLAAKKPGRPAKAKKDQPWIAAGLPRTTYYRRLKDGTL